MRSGEERPLGVERNRPGRQVERGQQRDGADEAHRHGEGDCRPPPHEAVVGDRPDDAEGDREVQETPRRQPPRVAPERERPEHRRAASEAFQRAELDLGDPEHVHHVVLERHAERWAEVPEKDEPRGPPERSRASALTESADRPAGRRAVESRRGLPHGPGRGGQRERREECDQQERPAVRHVRREVASDDPGQEARPVVGRPLDGLEARGETARLAFLDHHGIAEDVREGEPDSREPEDRERKGPRIRGKQAEGEPPQRRRGRRRKEVGPSSVPEERHQVRDEPVEGLHAPAEADQGEERGRLGRTQPHLVLQQEEDRLGGQPGLGLGETLDGVDGGEEDEETPERHAAPRRARAGSRRPPRRRRAPGRLTRDRYGSDDEVDLDQRAEREPGHADARASRQAARREVALVDGVHRGVVGKVDEVDAREDDPLEAGAGSPQHGLQVPHHLVGLLGDPAGDELLRSRGCAGSCPVTKRKSPARTAWL